MKSTLCKSAVAAASASALFIVSAQTGLAAEKKSSNKPATPAASAPAAPAAAPSEPETYEATSPDTGSPTGMSHRMMNKLGLSVSILGDPYPSLPGINIGYNVFDFLRASAGVGFLNVASGVSITNFGFGGDLFVPGWNLSPTVGFHFTSLNLTLTGAAVGASSLISVSGSTSLTYIKLGFDWQTSSGLVVGAGYQIPLVAMSGLPYAEIGYYFNLF